MSQLQLLNTTVSSLALSVNRVLTECYALIFDDETSELLLSTAPLAATEEVEKLYASGVIDIETAIPVALHSLGCSAEAIADAVVRRRRADAEQKKAEKAEAKAVAAEAEQREQNAEVEGKASAEEAKAKAASAAVEGKAREKSAKDVIAGKLDGAGKPAFAGPAKGASGSGGGGGSKSSSSSSKKK
jgi:hypothetical protein